MTIIIKWNTCAETLIACRNERGNGFLTSSKLTRAGPTSALCCRSSTQKLSRFTSCIQSYNAKGTCNAEQLLKHERDIAVSPLAAACDNIDHVQ